MSGTVGPAEPEVESSAGPALELVGTLEIGALPGTSEVVLTAGISQVGWTVGTFGVELAAGTSEVVELVGISGIVPAVAGIFEVGRFAW